MAIPFLNNLNLSDNQLLNAKAHVTSTAPTAAKGQIYLDSSDNILKYHNGTVWVSLVASTGGTVTNVSSATTGQLTVANESTTPVLSIVTAPVTNGASALVTGDHVYDFVTGLGYLTTADIEGTTNEIEVSVVGGKVKVGLPDNVLIAGDLTVIGKTITNHVETVSTSNGVVFEGNVADDNELTLLAGTLTADRTIYLPDASGTVALLSDLSGGVFATTITDTATVTHGFNTRDVIVQLFDLVTYETIYTDVVRNSVNAVTITFASTPTNSIRVLVTKIG
jgi:hypothetical protein